MLHALRREIQPIMQPTTQT